MKAKKITYSRLVSKGNYENCKIEIELEVEKGENAADVFDAAKKWVNDRVYVEQLSAYKVEAAERVLEDKRNHTMAQIEEAERILSMVSIRDGDEPF
jgi:Ser-tRNA(Ala) deacylase AlaX